MEVEGYSGRRRRSGMASNECGEAEVRQWNGETLVRNEGKEQMKKREDTGEGGIGWQVRSEGEEQMRK